uniref:Putative membrane protein insertion efficiency factor n=1 Tax=Schlesneria paludicola TaxID=360056 RepID=A0A7C2PAR1_9PLAN
MTIWGWLRRLPVRSIVLAVRFYQLAIGPWLGQRCRFVPSCSAYMIEAVEKYGAIRGVWKGLCRIGRCHPLHPGGWDPP